MSTPTLKELCAKATKGPYSVNSTETADFYSAIVVQAESPFLCVACLEHKEVETPVEANEANAQLIARLSPEVMVKVYEALTKAKEQLRQAEVTSERVGKYVMAHEYSDGQEACGSALALLDGKPETTP